MVGDKSWREVNEVTEMPVESFRNNEMRLANLQLFLGGGVPPAISITDTTCF